MNPVERERALPFAEARLEDRAARRGRVHVERDRADGRGHRRRARRDRGERDLDVPFERRVGRGLAHAAEDLFEPLGEVDRDLRGARRVALRSDLRVARLLARAVQTPLERDLRLLPLGERRADHLEPIARLDLARRDVERVDEARRGVARAAERDEGGEQGEERDAERRAHRSLL